jgi:UTP--glucose-1-phosphate uridylyltransferase
MAYRKAVERLRFRFMTQEGPYGNATPLLTAIPHLKNEPCIYAFGDDIVLRENVTTSLLELYATAQCPILAAQEVTAEAAASFGIIEAHDRNGLQYVSRLLEKPKPGDTPSRLASLGRYLVTPEILACLSATETGREGELWFVDAILAHMKKGGSVATLTLRSGKWFTVGDPPNFCQAVQEAYLAGATPFDSPKA